MKFVVVSAVGTDEYVVNANSIELISPVMGGDDWSGGAFITFRSDRRAIQIDESEAKRLTKELTGDN